MLTQKPIEIWGGIEGTINRVKDQYIDQSEFSGHYNRENDIDLIASLGIKMLRYPVLWEKHQPEKDQEIDWAFAEKNLLRLKELQVEPIAGLVHHGSGPKHVDFFDGSFEEGVANYAKLVAAKFPWLEYYTPVNEPLTTARFCGLYGHWYPHKADAYSFYKILLSECKATVMAMKAIREINPDAKLIQTEDLGKVYSTPKLKYQADFENERRWLSYDLITGTLTPDKEMWSFLLRVGIKEQELRYFLENNCPPHILGFNYYITSERYLDENLQKYPKHVHGGNGRDKYADVEVVRVPYPDETGPMVLLREAWERYKMPMAITECHLHCTREEQMRWFNEMWENINHLKTEGVDVRALTAWAILGTYGWNTLVTKPWGDYESGVFNLSSGSPRPTAMSRLIQVLAKHQVYYHPVLETAGWWKQEKRVLYPDEQVFNIRHRKPLPKCQPVLILGKAGMLTTGFNKVCEERNIHHLTINTEELKLKEREPLEELIQELNPWAVIHTDEFEEINKAELDQEESVEQNFKFQCLLAEVCKKYSVKLVTYSSAFVFDGNSKLPYRESDPINPINAYGQTRAKAEQAILELYPQTMIIRTGNCFSCWDNSGFVSTLLSRLKERRSVTVDADSTFSVTYIPDLVNISLDLLLDNECGIVHVANQEQTTQADFARTIAEHAGFDTGLIKAVPSGKLRQKTKRPQQLVLTSEKGIKLPSYKSALIHFFDHSDILYMPGKIAV